MTDKKKIVTKAAKSTAVDDANVPVEGLIIALSDSTIKTASVLASALMFSQPQFAAQVTPTNVLGLADLMYKYISGEVNMSQPETTGATPPAPVFS